MPPGTLIHQSITDEGIIEIVQEQSRRALYFGSSAKQSEMDMLQPERLVLSYTQAMMAALLFCPSPKSVLLIGLGGGSLVRFILHHFSDCRIDVVEFRHDVVKLAIGYFGIPNDGRLHIAVGDGYDFLLNKQGATCGYDLILIDAFDHEGIADSIKSHTFFTACRSSLNGKGVAAINLWNSKRDHYTETLANIESAFADQTLALPVREKGNVIVFATPCGHDSASFRDMKSRSDELGERLGLPMGTYLRELRRHNRWRALHRLL